MLPHPGAGVMTLPRVLTHGQAAQCQAEMVRSWPASTEHPRVVLDASALDQFDSSALAVLLFCQRQAKAVGQVLAVMGAPARLLQLARLYGVADLLQLQTPPTSGTPAFNAKTTPSP
jgi:phospholipid transport system transporter-binding protein